MRAWPTWDLLTLVGNFKDLLPTVENYFITHLKFKGNELLIAKLKNLNGDH